MSEVVETQAEQEGTPDAAAAPDPTDESEVAESGVTDSDVAESDVADSQEDDASTSAWTETKKSEPLAKPQDLRTLVVAMGNWRKAPVSDTYLVVLSPTAALPQAKRTRELDAQIGIGVAKIAGRRGATLYRVSKSDLAVIVQTDAHNIVNVIGDLKIQLLRGIEHHCPSSFGCIDQNRMVTTYDLSSSYQQAASRLSRYAARDEQETDDSEDGSEGLRPLSDDDARNVMMAYKEDGPEKFVKSFVRSQAIIRTEFDRPVRTLMNEYYVSIGSLRKTLLADVELRGSGQAFNDFTLMLDQVVLRAFKHIDIAPGLFSINLNVQTVFTKVFKNFMDEIPRPVLANMIFEFRQPNIVEFFDSFVTARDLIRAAGGRIAVDRIFPDTLGLVDLDYLGAMMGKVHWRNGADEAFIGRAKAIKYMQECGVHPVMIRVDDQQALNVGSKLGFQQYQGFHVDNMMKQGALH